jgi:hypothetical protein
LHLLAVEVELHIRENRFAKEVVVPEPSSPVEDPQHVLLVRGQRQNVCIGNMDIVERNVANLREIAMLMGKPKGTRSSQVVAKRLPFRHLGGNHSAGIPTRSPGRRKRGVPPVGSVFKTRPDPGLEESDQRHDNLFK